MTLGIVIKCLCVIMVKESIGIFYTVTPWSTHSIDKTFVGILGISVGSFMTLWYF